MSQESMLHSFSSRTLAVETHGLVKRFKKTTALAGLDLAVPESSVYLLVGPNGAGKTTVLRTLLDMVRPTSGTATVFGLDTNTGGDRIRAATGWVPEQARAPYGWMSVERMLRYHAQYFPSWDTGYERHLREALRVKDGERCANLSKGETRKVQLVMAMAHRPALLVFDEPTDGLDPLIRDRFQSLLADHIAGSPTTVLISSHLVHESAMIADHIGVIDRGRLHAQFDRATLESKLKRYTAVVPDGWQPPGALPGRVLSQRIEGSEARWVIFGDEAPVTDALRAAGVDVRDVKALTFAEAAPIIMESQEVPV